MAAPAALALPGTIARADVNPPSGAAVKRKAAVIGHTGKGDYGHGLESIFMDRAGIETVAVADPDRDGCNRAAMKIGAPRIYADYQEMLNKEQPHLVSVAMRQSALHYEIVLACLRGGAHVYCEKPFTTALWESDHLMMEAARRRLRIGVAHTLRAMPAIRRLKHALGEGVLGDLTEVRAYGKQDARAGGEDMMVLGTHLFDLLRLFLGDPAWCTARVLWQGRDLQREDARLVNDNVGWVAGNHVFAQFAFAQGINATFTSVPGFRDTVGHWGIEFWGTKGAAKINCDQSPNVFLRRTVPWKPEGRQESWEPIPEDLGKTAPQLTGGPVGDWLQATEQGREPECSARNGAWAVEMVMGIYQAALSGQRATFPLRERNHPLSEKPPV